MAIFYLGIFPAEPMRKTEMAARHYQQVVTAPAATPVADAGRKP